jgi:hypothetical protein
MKGAYLLVMLTWKKALLAGSILLLDLGVLVLLGVLMMDYDDSYAGPSAEYGAWHTMTPFQRGVSLSHSLWLGANALALVAVAYWLIKRRTQRLTHRNRPLMTV